MECSRCGMPARPDERICHTCGAALAPVAGQDGGQAASSAAPVSAEPSVLGAGEGLDASAAPGPAMPVGERGTAAEQGLLGATSREPAAASAAVSAGATNAPGMPPGTAGIGAAPASGAVGPGYAYPYGYGAYGPYGAYAGYGANRGYSAYAPQQGYQGQPAAYPPATHGYPGYAYASSYYPGYYYAPQPPRKAPGETYRTVLAWIVTVGSGLCIVGGLLLGLLSAVAYVRGGLGLAALGDFVGVFGAPLVGGIAGLYFGITALMHRPSVRFSFPHWGIFLGLAVLAIGGDVVIWNVAAVPGSALAMLPLFVLAGLLPALAILAFAARRLHYPTTWRHVMMSLVYGAAVAPLVASILNLAAYYLIVVALQSFGVNVTFDANFLQNLNPSNAGEAIAFLLLGSVAAPLIEEGLKPLGAVLVMPRLRGPNEAFLVGMAAGLGFAVVETLGYFGMGEADWVTVAIGRFGAGLVHGVGAGMAAMGWYYLIRGKGVSHRWLRGFGALSYAVVQHALFNGSNLLGVVPPIGAWLSQPVYLGRLPLDGGVWLAFALYALILVVLLVVSGRLRSMPASGAKPDSPGARDAGGPANLTPQPVQGGAR